MIGLAGEMIQQSLFRRRSLILPDPLPPVPELIEQATGSAYDKADNSV
jgi:hypothetical protein